MAVRVTPNGWAARRARRCLSQAFPSRLSPKWAGKNNRVAVWIAQPELPIAIFAQATLLQDLHSHTKRAAYGSVEVVQLEPQNDAISVWSKGRISERTMIVFRIPSVQLQNELVARHEALILVTPMPARAAEKLLVPSADCWHIVNTDEGRKSHVEVSYVVWRSS